MTVNKLTYPAKENAVQEKINEIIDNMAGTITVDQTYDGTSTNPQSGVAIAGANFIQNTATYTSDCLGIGHNCSVTASDNALGIGQDVDMTGTGVSIGDTVWHFGTRSTAIGSYSEIGSGCDYCTAIGQYALIKDNIGSAIQLGYGRNNFSNTFSVGFYIGSSASQHKNWQLLDGTTGLIPDDRLSTNIARSSDIPAAQVNSDWNAVSGVAQILNKPTLSTVATSGSYNDLTNKPTIPTVNNATLTIQKNGTDVQTFTANASSNVTANITVPTDTSDLTNGAGYITGITSGDVTTALGYTPYNSTNPNGYTSNVGTVTSVNSNTPDSNGDVTLVIPTDTSDLTNNAGFITSSALSGYATETWVGNQGYITGITSSDVTTALGYTPQEELVSGTNIKTVNGQSLLGSGNLQTPYRNIGEIVESVLPQTDAGLHLLDGALISGSGSYADFVTYIAGLVSDYPDLFETEANWQTAVTTYGVCGKFVYDDVNNTVRLPKITGIVEGTTDLTALGDLVEAGLPSIQHTHTYVLSQYASAKWFASTSSHTANPSYVDYTTTVNSAVSPIYGKSNTVQPQTIKVLYYIVIANSTKTDIEVDIDDIATDLNGKADVDLTNTSNVLATSFLNKLAPDYSNGVSIWNGTTNTTYTVINDGWYFIDLTSSTTGVSKVIYINGHMVGAGYYSGVDAATAFVPLKKNDIITLSSAGTMQNYLVYYPYVGGS